MMYIADAHGRLDAARNEGFQEGLQQGRLARKCLSKDSRSIKLSA